MSGLTSSRPASSRPPPTSQRSEKAQSTTRLPSTVRRGSLSDQSLSGLAQKSHQLICSMVIWDTTVLPFFSMFVNYFYCGDSKKN